MITEYHFPTPIYIKDLPNAVQLNQYLEQQILKWKQNDPWTFPSAYHRVYV